MGTGFTAETDRELYALVWERKYRGRGGGFFSLVGGESRGP